MPKLRLAGWPPFLPLILLLTQLLGASPALAAAEPIGTLGAVTESESWQRAQLSDGLGRDQFRLGSTEHYLVSFELFLLFDQRSDFESRLDERFANLEDRLTNFQADPEMLYERLDGYTRATRRCRGMVNGLSLVYQLDILSAGDGVGYLFLSWSLGKQAEEHFRHVDAWVESFRLPGEDTAWAIKRRPSAHSFEFGRHTVELTFADSVFSPDDQEPGERYSFTAEGGEVGLHIFVSELDGGMDEALDQVVSVALSNKSSEELLRADLDLPAGKGRQVVVRKQPDAEEAGFDLAVAVVPIEPGVWVDLRLVSPRSVGHRERLWQTLLQSLRIKSAPKLDAFPEVEPEKPAPAMSAAARQLLTNSRRLAGISWANTVAVEPDGDLLAWKSYREGELVRYSSAEAEPEVLLHQEEGSQGQPVVWGEELLLLENGEETQKVTAEGLEPAGFRAEAASAWGETLLFARTAAAKQLSGLGTLPVIAPTELVLRQPAGEERVLARLDNRRVKALALGEEFALVASEARYTELSGETTLVELARAELGTGKLQPLGSWRDITRLEAHAKGFLASGTTEEGMQGVFLLTGVDATRRELLIAGDVVGLALSAGELTFSSTRCLVTEGWARCVYRSPLDLVRQHGAGFWPWNVARFNAVADQAAAQAGGEAALAPLPATRAHLDGFLAAAAAQAKVQVGWPLPSGVAEVDLLFDDLANEEELSLPAEALLASLIAQALLSEGAEWVEGASPTPASRRAQLNPNSFAFVAYPPEVLRDAGGEDGWYSPISTLLEEARGRRILLGADPAKLAEHLRGSYQKELPRLLAQGSEKELATLLAAQPGNQSLRDTVYRHLAAHGREDLVARLAEPFASASNAKSEDVIAFCAARLAGKLSTQQSEELVAKLRQAITAAPGEAALYVVLGAAYERSGRDERLELAKACYEKATEISKWSDAGREATTALERLAEKR